MLTKLLSVIVIYFFISLVAIAAENRSDIELSSSYRYTYNRTMGHKNELYIHGNQNLTDHLNLSTGFSTAFNSLPESFFLNLTIRDNPTFLRYRISLLSRDFPEYEIRENSIYPTVSLMTKYFELELGMSLRFLETYTQIITYHTLYRLQLNFLNTTHYDLIFRMSNFDLYKAGNITDLYYSLRNSFKINDHFAITADIGLQNSGQLSFTSYYSTFYGQVGVKYRR